MGPVDFVVHCSNDNEHCIKLHFRSKYPTAEALVVLDACPSLDIYIYIYYIVSKVGGRDYEQLIASFHLGSPPYSPFGAVIQQGFLRK